MDTGWRDRQMSNRRKGQKDGQRTYRWIERARTIDRNGEMDGQTLGI